MIKRLCLLISIIMLMSLFAGCSGQLLLSGENGSFDRKKINIDLVKGNSRFAFNIFKQINKEDENKSVFISPLSISTALTMTYLGAGTSTKEAMAKALEYTGISDDMLNESYKNLVKYLKQPDKKIELNISNSLWIREGEVIKENFLSSNKDIFDASVNYLDLSNANAADTINKWISDATKKKIEKMLEPPIPSDIVMYLINAIYFKGDWKDKFNERNTYDTLFNAGNGLASQAMMMSKNGRIEYGQGDGYKAVRLPYGSGNIAMYCTLPEKNVPGNKFIEALDDKKWKDIKTNILKKKEVNLNLPRFKVDYGIKNLNDSLSSLGMEEAFSGTADFSGIRDGICISRVLHKAVIEVNEKGSEAAAATVVEMKETAAADPLTFIADRPFVFVIADDVTGTILFMGKLYDVK